MARYLGPKHKICKRFGVPLCGTGNCPVLKSSRKTHLTTARTRRRRPKKLSDYGVQLAEKQKAKAIYKVLEKQFRRYFEKATAKKDATGEALLQLLETRLDNVVYRLGFAKTRPAARQLVSHRHILVNDKKVSIPSYQMKIGDVIALTPKTLKLKQVEEQLKQSRNGQIPPWLKREGPVGKVLRNPARAEIGEPVTEQLIVDYYSR